jgi:hypothetical protein
MKKINNFIFWTPRILLLIFALFLVIFSFDVFDSATSVGEIILALFLHNLPSMILLIILGISWKHDLVGAIIFMIFGIACVVGIIISLAIVPVTAMNPMFIIGSIVFLFIGILFLVGWYKKRK